jgi:pimeloyl-ACP methyl ester carboxylesterase
MTSFALIHGGWHGAWCWELLTPELQQRGHRVVTVDLPSEDAGATFDDYADIVAAALEEGCDIDDDTVLVGHSLGGYVLPLVAQRRSVSRLVYICALVADPGRSAAEQDREDRMVNRAHWGGLAKVDGCTHWVDRDLARAMFYQDCDERIGDEAFPRLRGQASHPLLQPCTLAQLPSVPSTYIVCADDQMIDPTWSRRVAAERLKAALVELPGGHSPFYSRPSELADVLDRLS